MERLASSGWVPPELASDGVRYFPSRDGAPISYPEGGFEVLGLEGGTGFWFEHRSAAVRRQVDRLAISSMWEVGAGTGAMARRLRDVLDDIVTVEPLAAGARASAAAGLVSLCGTLHDLQLPDASIEAIGVFDVLEHLEDPAELICEMNRVLRPGGVVIATVPAFQALWGEEDDVAGHQRRYTRSSLDGIFAPHRLFPLGSEYLFASLVPPAAVMRAMPYRLGRRSTPEEVFETMRSQLTVKPNTDRMARVVLAAETAIARVVPLPFGLTVMGVYWKR